jgi:hypothetical protein
MLQNHPRRRRQSRTTRTTTTLVKPLVGDDVQTPARGGVQTTSTHFIAAAMRLGHQHTRRSCGNGGDVVTSKHVNRGDGYQRAGPSWQPQQVGEVCSRVSDEWPPPVRVTACSGKEAWSRGRKRVSGSCSQFGPRCVFPISFLFSISFLSLLF